MRANCRLGAACVLLVSASCVWKLARAAGDSVQVFQTAAVAAAPATTKPAAPGMQKTRRANFGLERASPQALKVANWIVDTADNQGMPFMIIDKVHSRALMFGVNGQLQGAAPVLLGLARGDDSTPDIGTRELSKILPHERTTPAGRFIASLHRDIHGQELLWVDYDSALSLHRVVPGKPSERRGQRLKSLTPDDNRITFGCINVPVRFYESLVSPAFTGTNGVVYILPETRTIREVFGSSDLE